MSYQVRHRHYGVFQGVEKSSNGVGMCYHPAAASPEMGYCEFASLEVATEFVKWALSIHNLEYSPDDLTIEDFNKGRSERLQRFGIHVITLDHWARLVDKPNG